MAGEIHRLFYVNLLHTFLSQRVFCVTRLGGLYLEGLIHGGAYFQNFTVYLDKYVPYLYQEYSQWLQI